MALQTFSNLESLLSIRTKINANFTELYSSYTLKSANNLSDLTNVVTARSNLGLVIGADVQAWDADLSTLAAAGMTGTGLIVMQTSPTLITPTLGVARFTSLTAGTGSNGLIIYNVADEVTNFELLQGLWSSNIFFFGTGKGGSGTARGICISSSTGSVNGSSGNNTRVTITQGTGVNFNFNSSSTGNITEYIKTPSTFTASSVVTSILSLSPVINMTSTGGYNLILMNPTETAVGSGGGAFIRAQIGGSARLIVTNTLATLIGIGTEVPTHSITLASTTTGLALYNTVDQVTNYERVRMQRNSNRFDITQGTGGSGTNRAIRIGTASGAADTSGGSSFINYGADNITYTIRSGSSATLGHLFTIGNNTASSGVHTLVSITENIFHTGTAGYTGLLINPTEGSIGSGAKHLIIAQVGGVTKFSVDNNGVIKIGNTVAVAVSVASTHKVTIDIGGTTYYLLATT